MTTDCNSNPEGAHIVRLSLLGIPRSKPPVIEFYEDHWRVWTAYNSTLTEGSYIALFEDGAMTRVTILPDGTEQYNRL
jgi:hypothetical protein